MELDKNYVRVRNRPRAIGIVSTVVLVTLIFSLLSIDKLEPNANYRWYFGISAVIGSMTAIGMWNMKKWSVLTATGLTIIQITIVIINSWDIALAVFSSALAIVGWINFKKMSPGDNEKERYVYVERKRPPYLLGLLGFIPLIGAFVGMGLLWYAIYRYKDRKLAIIGGGCILFTVVIYSSLFYIARKFADDGAFSDIAQKDMNGLIENIEFF